MEQQKLKSWIRNSFFVSLTFLFSIDSNAQILRPDANKTMKQHSFSFGVGGVGGVGGSGKSSGKLFCPKEKVEEGGVFFVSLELTRHENLKEIQASFLSQNLNFIEELKGSGHYTALVGVDYGTAEGTVELPIKLFSNEADSSPLLVSCSIEVKPGHYPSEELSVPPKTVMPSKKDLKIIQKDKVYLAKVYSNSIKKVNWGYDWAIPVEVPKELSTTPEKLITSVYGSSRVYNKQKQNVHLGTDFRAPTGTKIFSPTIGKVVLAKKLFYTGNTVILDHGYGFFSIYAHMSKIKTKLGANVKRGALLGLSGSTGRASGPHLHWGLQLNGIKLDPMVVFKTLK
jgi:murein DD-endopeptidase MepM/ murein hydrolase activator NlpD